MSGLQEHTERAERKRTETPILDALTRLLPIARAEHERLVERALDSLERDFGFSRERVNERGELEVTAEEFARLRTNAAVLEKYEGSSPFTGLEIRVVVVKPEPMCDRTLQCEATKEHFLSCHAAPWKAMS